MREVSSGVSRDCEFIGPRVKNRAAGLGVERLGAETSRAAIAGLTEIRTEEGEHKIPVEPVTGLNIRSSTTTSTDTAPNEKISIYSILETMTLHTPSTPQTPSIAADREPGSAGPEMQRVQLLPLHDRTYIHRITSFFPS